MGENEVQQVEREGDEVGVAQDMGEHTEADKVTI